MLDPKFFEDIAKKVSDSVPPGLLKMKDELEKNAQAALQAGFSKLDLITREEFDVQTKVLSRTRERLEELEERVAALEENTPTNTKEV